MATMKIQIRKMISKDSLQVAALHVRAWQCAYSGIIPQAYLDRMSIDKKKVEWELGFELNSDVIRLVAVNKQQVVGFAAGLESRYQSEHLSDVGELWAFYIHPDYQRRGIGNQLLKYFQKTLATFGYHSMNIWVLEENGRAREFYQQAGASQVQQSRTTNFGGKTLIEICYNLEF